jgi:C1A family cysteine protease
MKKIFFTLFILLSYSIHAQISKELFFKQFLNSIEKRGRIDETYQAKILGKEIKQEASSLAVDSKLSPGEIKVLEQKKKIREQIKQKRDQEKATTSEKASDIYSEHRNWLKEIAQTHQATLEQWKKAQREYEANIPSIKKSALIDQDILEEIKHKISKKELTKELSQTHYYLVDKILELPIKNQGLRPTCSAFVNSYMLESILIRHNRHQELSEQYLYWASKPDCHNKSCSIAGAWITYALDYSKEAKSVDIPTEQRCPYVNKNNPSNQTQQPLNPNCHNGEYKVVKYELYQNNQNILEQIKKNKVVYLSTKLTENFYKNDGLVLASEQKPNQNKLDHHASGHALAIIGVLPLPDFLWPKEGKNCFLVANSWGEGFGLHGYTCLSEKWLNQNRVLNPLVVISKIVDRLGNTYE